MNNFKKSALFLSIGVSLVAIIGCSKDTSFTKKVKGTDDYLYVSNPTMINIPESMVLPASNAEYEIALPGKEGSLGEEVDITPPSLGLTSTDVQIESELVQESISDELYASVINAINAKDETSSPIVLFDANFEQVWQALLTNLPRAGFEIIEQNKSTGLIKAEYSSLSNDELTAFGMIRFNLPEGVYNIQLGDLKDKTSAQLRNEDNVYLREDLNKDLSRIFDQIIK
ncbi:outer membrane protein assembly factor BamC [Thorsellia kenyensis]|uniref:Outer membrane protein assembly factor BamC n=1 Tax=Thorsellia kenyensis TaxID=1549888 RepID=A0ABV6C7G7_9GAMM